MNIKGPLTTGFLGAVEQDAVDRGSDEDGSARLLDDGDHVVGDLSGAAFRVPGAVQVVSDEQAVHGEAGVFRHVAWSEEEMKSSVSRAWRRETLTAAGSRLHRTVGAEDVGEDGSQVLVLRQPVDHLRQAAVGHLEEGGQTPGQAGVDQELGDGEGDELQHSQEPDAPPNFLRINTQMKPVKNHQEGEIWVIMHHIFPLEKLLFCVFWFITMS